MVSVLDDIIGLLVFLYKFTNYSMITTLLLLGFPA